MQFSQVDVSIKNEKGRSVAYIVTVFDFQVTLTNIIIDMSQVPWFSTFSTSGRINGVKL